MAPNEMDFPPAPLWRRLMAMTYDSLLLTAVILAYGYSYLGIEVALFGKAFEDTLKQQPAGTSASPPMFFGMLACIYLFFYIFWHRKGQTLGMQVWCIKIIQKNGALITAQQTFLRLLIAPISFLLFGLGYFWCLAGNKQSWHDMASKTKIILVPKKD